jgi:hypothetical protein
MKNLPRKHEIEKSAKEKYFRVFVDFRDFVVRIYILLIHKNRFAMLCIARRARVSFVGGKDDSENSKSYAKGGQNE